MMKQTTEIIGGKNESQSNKINKKVNSNKLTTVVTESFNELKASSEQLGVTVKELESATQSQTSGIEEVSTSIQSISTAIQGVATNASKAMEMIQQSEKITQNISVDAEKGMEKMDNMKKIVSESATDVKALAKELVKVDNMTGFITQIAEQTNLLALNAAIEAARAGDVGRGFAVVADEVRRLAENSKKGAEDISDLINSLKESSNKTTTSIEKGNGLVEESYDMVTGILKSIKDIAASMTEVVSQMQEISAATEEVSSGTEEATAAGEEILSISQTNLESFENIVKSKEKEEKLFEQVDEITGKLFRSIDIMDELSIVMSLDDNGIITEVNNFLSEVSRYPVEELIGQSQEILGSGWHDKKMHENQWSVLKSGKTYKTYKRNRAKDGTIYWLKIAISPVVRDGIIVRYEEIGTVISGFVSLLGLEDAVREQEAGKALTNPKFTPILKKLKSGDYEMVNNIPI